MTITRAFSFVSTPRDTMRQLRKTEKGKSLGCFLAKMGC